MVNYQNGKVYRIVCNQTGLQYIGSTTIPLATRLSQHRKLLKDDKSGTSKKILENNDYNIVLIEDYPCFRKEELLQRERYYIEMMECVNKKVPMQSQKEWYEKNKERLIEKQTVWNNNNREKLREYQKTFKANQVIKNKGIFVNLNEDSIDLNNAEDIIEYEDIFNNPEFIESQK
jgi:predicted GIY-YIG superfamily endonuclease